MAHGARLETINNSHTAQAQNKPKSPDGDSVIIPEPINGAVRKINGKTYTWSQEMKHWSLSPEAKLTQNGAPTLK